MKVNTSRELYTTLYGKPTDTDLYLHYISSHHVPSKPKGPYGQFLRLRHICTCDKDFQHSAEKLVSYYIKRGYPEKALRKHYSRASKYSQDELLEVVPKTQADTPVMVTNYNPCNPCGQLLTNKPIVGFRRLPNLRDMLTNTTLTYPLATPIPNICTRLGKCTYCPILKKLAIVKGNFTHKSFKPLNHQNTSLVKLMSHI